MLIKEQNDQALDYHQLAMNRKNKTRKELKTLWEEESDLKFYSWDFKENYAYITYLKNFKNILASAESRKRVKVFSHISRLIKTRNPFQIKSHHQKMMLRHKNIEAVIDYLKLKILKYLKSNPQGIEDIESINRQCETFFIQQSDLLNDRGRRKFDPKPQAELIHRFSRNIIIKTEVNADGNQQVEYKNQKIVHQAPPEQFVKVEEDRQMIQIIHT